MLQETEKLRIPSNNPNFSAYSDLRLYSAGSGYPQNFSRDAIEAGLIADDPFMLRDQLIFGMRLQARVQDPFSGAQPFAFHHQYPSVVIRDGLNTGYAATDVTALQLIGLAYHYRATGDRSLLEHFRPNIVGAVEKYIFPHLSSNYLFQEDPKFSGATSFALLRTDWKDSTTPGRPNGEVFYPAVYPLPQAQYIRALRGTGKLLGSDELVSIADKMSRSLKLVFDRELGTSFLALDREGPVRGINSDALNMMFYLEPRDFTPEQLEQTILSSRKLETQAGYLCLDPGIAATIEDDYHARVWPKEQAIIHKGASKFLDEILRTGPKYLIEALIHVMDVASRVKKFLDSAPETLKVRDGIVEKAGCDPQLWTIAAKEYFHLIPR